MFLGSHEHQLVEVSMLLRHTADPLAADVVQSLVALISSMAVRPIIWNSVQQSIRESLFVSVSWFFPLKKQHKTFLKSELFFNFFFFFLFKFY